MANSFGSKTGGTNARQIQKQWNTYKANKSFKKQLTKAEKKQPTYKNAYRGLENALVNNLENGGFEYDSVNNPVYQAYAQDYRLLGNIAADQSAANIEDLSGGYGTTYSGDVASQQLSNYLANEKAILPALMQQERANYQSDVSNLINKGNLYNQLESQDFAQYQDKLNRWNQNREYAYNKFITDYQQSAKTHTKNSGSENSWATSSETSVSPLTASSRRGSKSSNKNSSNIKLGDFLTREEYVHYRAQLDRDYNAGWDGVEEGDPDYKTKRAAEDKVDSDYYEYIKDYLDRKGVKKGYNATFNKLVKIGFGKK